MSYDTRLCKLVIENMKVLEVAPGIIDQVDMKLFHGLDERCNRFVKESEWLGNINFNESGICFYPEAWQAADEVFASYDIDYIGDEVDCYDLTRFVGQASGSQVAFTFAINHKMFDITKKKYVEKLAQSFENTPELENLGFKFTDYYLSLPFKLDSSTLAEEYPHFDCVFEPVDKALATIKQGHGILAKLVNDMVEEVGFKEAG